MTASKSHSHFTPEEYLEVERISLLKHEYIQGQLVATSAGYALCALWDGYESATAGVAAILLS